MKNFRFVHKKYVPRTFKNIIDQKLVIKSLKNYIKWDNIPNVMLFFGPSGVGKTICAKIFSKSVNHNNHDVIELNSASNNSVDDVRRIINQTKFPPQFNKYKIYILDEIHMFSNSAFNCLLKVLENSPKYIIFILITTEIDKIPLTVLSRSQIYEFNVISNRKIFKSLKLISFLEDISINNISLDLVCKSSKGNMRNALMMMDKIISLCGKRISTKIVKKMTGHVKLKIYLETLKNIKNNNLRYIKYIMKYVIDEKIKIKDFIFGFMKVINSFIMNGNLNDEKINEYFKFIRDFIKFNDFNSKLFLEFFLIQIFLILK